MNTTRREFIAYGAVAAGAGPLFAAEPEKVEAKAKFSAWDEVPLGKTGIRTTRLGFGTGVSAHNRSSGIIRRNGHEGAVKLIRAAYERGIRFFDTADSYGTHDVIREALAPFPRSSYTICTKYWYQRGGIPEADHTDVETSVNRFLRELGTDYIDILQIHCVSQGDWPTALQPHMDGLERCRFKKPFKDKPEARTLTDTDASEIRQDRYRRLTKKAPDPSGDPRLWPYRGNKYGYWIWRDGWICNKCGGRNRNLPDDKTIIPMDWTGSRFCPHCGIKMGG